MIRAPIPTALNEGLYWAMRMGYKYSQEFRLVPKLVSSAIYFAVPDPKLLLCHPLETVIIGREVVADKLEQIAATLGVDLEWLAGFDDRYAGRPPRQDGGTSYLEGFAVAGVKEITKQLTDERRVLLDDGRLLPGRRGV